MNIKKILFIYILIFIVSFIFSESFDFSMFNDKLTEEEKTKLLNGQMVIRNIDTKENMCLQGFNHLTKRILLGVEDLNPNYTAEVIYLIKDDENRTKSVTKQLNEILLKLEDYAGIPYYSQRNKIWRELYSSVVMKEKNTFGSSTTMKAVYEMEPFGFFDCDIILEKDDEELFYLSKNTSKLTYSELNITCVKPENMHVYISTFKHDGYSVLYGVGGVAAPSIFFMRKRIETSFINRIKTFCAYMFEKLQ
ncbi:MAG: hypothetical protein GX220_02340 [Treponema sp.]|nr:hypothetical protein [Treponema sp.]